MIMMNMIKFYNVNIMILMNMSNVLFYETDDYDENDYLF